MTRVHTASRPALLVVAALAACGIPEGDYFGKADPDPEPGRFRWCNSGEPEALDPALATSTTDLPLAYVLFDGLTDYDMQGLPEPSLATRWDIAPDQRRFTFHLHDRGRWSSGRPITAHDFAYHLARVLHPLSFSRNAETLWKLKNGQLYTEGRVKQVLRDSGPFRAGDVVEVRGLAGVATEPGEPALVPDSNLRTAALPLPLRDLGAPADDAYAVVPPGEEVTLIELGREWAYVHWAEGDGVYGWTPAVLLTGQPNGEVMYQVRRVPRPHWVGVDIAPEALAAELDAPQPEAALPGRDLLMLPEVLGIRVPDDHTLVLETWGPVPYLIDLTPQRAFRATPREAVSRRPLRWTRPEHVVTSGPMHLVAWHERDRIELVASATYWRPELVKTERMTVYSLNDQAAAANYYMQGGCDAVASNHIPTSYLRVLSGEKRGRRYKDYIASPYLGIYYFLVNTEKLDNAHFRRALSHAIDRAPLPRILHGGQIPTVQHIPGTPIRALSDAELALCGVTRDTPGVAMIVATNELCYVPAPGLEFDLDKAREELALARQEMGAAFPQTISLKFNTGVEGHKLIAEYLQREWQDKLGLTIELSSQEWKTYLKATVAGEYEIGRFGTIGNFPDPESEFLAYFKCGAPDNRPRFCNEEYDGYMRAAESTSDRKQRLDLVRKAEEVLVREAPVIPMYVYTQHQLHKPYVRDLAVNLVNKQPLHRVWIDPDWDRAEGGR